MSEPRALLRPIPGGPPGAGSEGGPPTPGASCAAAAGGVVVGVGWSVLSRLRACGLVGVVLCVRGRWCGAVWCGVYVCGRSLVRGEQLVCCNPWVVELGQGDDVLACVQREAVVLGHACPFLPPACRLQCWCSGPVHAVRSSVCPRSHGARAPMRWPQRAQLTVPVATMGARRARSASWALSYPRACRDPLLLDDARVWVGQRPEVGRISGHPCSVQTGMLGPC